MPVPWRSRRPAFAEIIEDCLQGRDYLVRGVLYRHEDAAENNKNAEEQDDKNKEKTNQTDAVRQDYWHTHYSFGSDASAPEDKLFFRMLVSIK